MDDAEASATRTLEVVDRYPGVLHLPLTFALAEASRTLMNSRPGRSARASFPAAHVDALRVARASLAFARPAHASEGGLGGGGREKAIGGWCAFGDAIVAMLEKGVPGELDNLGAKVGALRCASFAEEHPAMSCVVVLPILPRPIV